ncbi:hypothetical protein E2562_021913 [Oryza meyeriana var. granulata]|uniref:Uncharacterized protein n=1 Tax=Oryza meyeriana var. granulata TaxID=110450 RepID=A0A6G1C850_9ORYZ|nr:hypothetical protein E2562_021913 [Oryza meyeriana var. granulata]
MATKSGSAWVAQGDGRSSWQGDVGPHDEGLPTGSHGEIDVVRPHQRSREIEPRAERSCMESSTI